MHYLTAILSGGGAGAWTAFLLPAMARHIGARGDFSPHAAIILILGGMALALLLSRLLRWAHPSKRVPSLSAIILPWTGVFFLPTSLLLPEGSRLFMTGSNLGPVKHVIAAAWILGTGLFATRLLPPILNEFSPAKVAAGFTAILLLISFSISTQPPNESDEGDYVAAALALIDSGTTRLDRIFINGDFNDFYFGEIPASSSWYDFLITYRLEKTDRYSYRMIGYPLVLAPFVKAAMMTEIPWLRWFISYLPGLAGFFLLILAIASLPAFMANRAGRNSAIIAIGSMTPLLYFPTNTQPEIWMAAGLAWAFLLRQRLLEKKDSGVVFALVTTLLMLLHERMAIFSAILLGATFFQTKERRRLLIVTGLCMIPVMLSYAAVLQFRLPGGAPHAYGIKGTPFFDQARWFEAARQHLFSIRIGLFTHLPTLLLIPLGIRWKDFDRKNPDGATRQIAAALFATYFLVIITYPHSLDSFPHLRYMAPVLPALGILLPAAIDRLLEKKWGPTTITFLLGLQIARAWPFLAVPHLWRWDI